MEGLVMTYREHLTRVVVYTFLVLVIASFIRYNWIDYVFGNQKEDSIYEWQLLNIEYGNKEDLKYGVMTPISWVTKYGLVVNEYEFLITHVYDGLGGDYLDIDALDFQIAEEIHIAVSGNNWNFFLKESDALEQESQQQLFHTLVNQFSEGLSPQVKFHLKEAQLQLKERSMEEEIKHF
jgi:hypothetical protein